MFHPNYNGDEYKEWLIRRISGYGMENKWGTAYYNFAIEYCL